MNLGVENLLNQLRPESYFDRRDRLEREEDKKDTSKLVSEVDEEESKMKEETIVPNDNTLNYRPLSDDDGSDAYFDYPPTIIDPIP